MMETSGRRTFTRESRSFWQREPLPVILSWENLRYFRTETDLYKKKISGTVLYELR